MGLPVAAGQCRGPQTGPHLRLHQCTASTHPANYGRFARFHRAGWVPSSPIKAHVRESSRLAPSGIEPGFSGLFLWSDVSGQSGAAAVCFGFCFAFGMRKFGHRAAWRLSRCSASKFHVSSVWSRSEPGLAAPCRVREHPDGCPTSILWLGFAA